MLRGSVAGGALVLGMVLGMVLGAVSGVPAHAAGPATTATTTAPAGAATSSPVVPRVTLRPVGRAQAFTATRVVVFVAAADYAGRVTVTASQNGHRLASDTARARNGRAVVHLVLPGAGAFALRASSAASGDVVAGTGTASVRATGRTLRRGSSGNDVRGLSKRLRTMGFLTPGHGGRYTFAFSEVVLAFQKAYGLRRTSVWGAAEWRTLATRSAPSAKFRTRDRHIEVDKSRQILMVVDDARPIGIIAVSTGATGNTPVGSFRIRQRGGSYLYRFMGFYRNFGIHGYVPVPAFPASHGCVREPTWAASWVWKHSAYGERVHIYR